MSNISRRGKGKAHTCWRLRVLGFDVLWVLGLRVFWVGWVVGILAGFWVLGLWEPMCIPPVYLKAPYTTSIKLSITYLKNKKKIHM